MRLKDHIFFQMSGVKATEDYTQSANTLFHFMKQQQFLESALLHRALFPRYCVEDIRYLDLCVNEKPFGEIAVLQKCFCDIPLHKLATNYELEVVEESQTELEKIDAKVLLEGNSHPEYYGRFAIAFSKKWCESRNLQPIHYLNDASSYTQGFQVLANTALNRKSLPKAFVADILQRLALVKPLRGKMKRYATHGGKTVEIEVLKNFHDEQEWRYIPDFNKLARINRKGPYRVDPIIANPNLLRMQTGPGERYLDSQSKLIEDKQYNELWLDFDYSDIRYLIVPDDGARLGVIEYIMGLPPENFTDSEFMMQQKYVLISKILMLDEIRKDW